MPKKPTEVSGQFGKLTVIHCNLPPRKRVLVRCECGKEFSTRSYDLLNGRTQSCGDTVCSTRSEDLLGRTFGYLTVRRLSSHKNSRGELLWVCDCACGKQRVAKSFNLINGFVKSCGCQKDFLRSEKLSKDPAEVLVNLLSCRYASGAKERGFSFKLSKSVIKQLVYANCTYCGSPPFADYVIKNIRGNRIIKYNGIDRVDSSKGYTKNNCVTCCKICNVAKSDLTVNEFQEWIQRIIKHNNA